MTPATNKRQKSRLLQNEPPLSPFAHAVALAYQDEMDATKCFVVAYYRGSTRTLSR